MADDGWLPGDLYLAVADEPVVRPGRPICQGDVFIGLPVLRGAQEVKPQQWKTKASFKPDALSMLVAHPCSSRSNATHRLKDDITLAPVIPVPVGWGAPWSGYYELFPLPGLRGDADFVADLSRGFPVRPEYLADRRAACLSLDGLAALLDRLAKNATRLEPAQVPGHFLSEAERLFFEFDLWELWTTHRGTEDGFQEWLDGPWGESSTRRRSLRMHFEEIRTSLEGTRGRRLKRAPRVGTSPPCGGAVISPLYRSSARAMPHGIYTSTGNVVARCETTDQALAAPNHLEAEEPESADEIAAIPFDDDGHACGPAIRGSTLPPQSVDAGLNGRPVTISAALRSERRSTRAASAGRTESAARP